MTVACLLGYCVLEKKVRYHLSMHNGSSLDRIGGRLRTEHAQEPWAPSVQVEALNGDSEVTPLYSISAMLDMHIRAAVWG